MTTSKRKIATWSAVIIAVLVLFSGWLWYGNPSQRSSLESTGRDPLLVEPDPELFPSVGLAKTVGWAKDETPAAANGLVVSRFADGLDHPRTMLTLPTGDVSRGTANLIGLPIGLNLVIQGQGMDGATATTLNLQRKNLDIGAMLGDTGRIEFRNMGITNVRTAEHR